ncbi:MAG: relaxase/mobilization nuclease domain-containing protein [Pseudomonadota bacterium]
MSVEDDFRIRPGRIGSSKRQRTRSAIAQALTAAQLAGGLLSRQGRLFSPRSSTFGRGRVAAVRAGHRMRSRTRGAVIKARVVKMTMRGSLGAHLSYLQRDGVTRDGERGQLFTADGQQVDPDDFAKRCENDRHHFRFIVSPDDPLEMADLRKFTRELMGQMEKDLGTRLDWTAVDHWNTEHPHIHVIVRGVGEDGKDLVISRDYIKEGMRGRAREIITRELGPRTEIDIRRSLERQVEAERWTEIDRNLARSVQRDGLIDMAPEPGTQPDVTHALKMGRLRKLERLDLAREIGPGQWTLSGDAEQQLRALGTRGDIVKRMHDAMAKRGIDRGTTSYDLDAAPKGPVIGKLIDRGLHDELSGTAYAIVDGIDGRTHHLTFSDIEATSDCRPGAIVELRRFEDRKGRARSALAVRSDMDLFAQVEAHGATWLDRRNLGQGGHDLGGGFGAEVREAMVARAQHLADEGLARRQGQRIIFARNLLDTLKAREVDAAGQRLSEQMGIPYAPSQPGEYVMGTVRQRLTLASGRFAMIDNGLGFALVPWTPSLDKQLGQHISGVMRGDGGVDWSFGRGRGLGL